MFLYIELVTEFETLLSFLSPHHVLTPVGFRGLCCLHRCFQMQLMCCTSRGEMFCHVSPLVLRIWPSSLGLSPKVSSFSELSSPSCIIGCWCWPTLEEWIWKKCSSREKVRSLDRWLSTGEVQDCWWMEGKCFQNKGCASGKWDECDI